MTNQKKKAIALARRVLLQEAETLREMADALDEDFWRIATLIAECPGIVWVTGVGTSAAVGGRFAHILTDCGARSVFLSPDLGLHGHSGAMAAGEVLVAISRGGESQEVNLLVDVAGNLGLKTIGLVQAPGSALARRCAHVLSVASPGEFELAGYAATTSSVAFSGICDALSAVVLTLKGYTREAFSRTHPGGAVGRDLYPHPLPDNEPE
jgi:arabinose-5-phosphate isomerase